MKDYIFLSLSNSLSRFRSVDINHSRSKISSSKITDGSGSWFCKSALLIGSSSFSGQMVWVPEPAPSSLAFSHNFHFTQSREALRILFIFSVWMINHIQVSNGTNAKFPAQQWLLIMLRVTIWLWTIWPFCRSLKKLDSCKKRKGWNTVG